MKVRVSIPPEMDEKDLDPFPVDLTKGDTIHQPALKIKSSPYEKPSKAQKGQKAIAKEAGNL
jgi:hypothetical protein